MLQQPRFILERKVGTRIDAEFCQFFRSARAYTMKSANWQTGDELWALFRQNNTHSIGLILVAGQLCDELIVTDTSARGKAGLLADRCTDCLGDFHCGPYALLVITDIKIGFIQGEWLDKIGIPREYIPNLAGDRFVGFKSWFYKNQVGALPLCGHGRHCRAHTESTRFIACRSHYAPLG